MGRPSAADYANDNAREAHRSAESAHKENESLRAQVEALRRELGTLGEDVVRLAALTGNRNNFERIVKGLNDNRNT